MKILTLFALLGIIGSTQVASSQSSGGAATSGTLPAGVTPGLQDERAEKLRDAGGATPRVPGYPGASQGWNVPLGQRDRTTNTVINRLIVHHTTNTGDESPYFKRMNERSSCPTWYVTSTGEVIEFIDPVKRPSSTGAANDYSLAIETQNTSRAPLWGISDASHESIARIAAWLSKQKQIGTHPVDFQLDRVHIIGHNEAGVNKTACPGPSMRLDWIVERAQKIAAEPAPSPAPVPRQD